MNHAKCIWKNYQENVVSLFQNLYNNDNYCDCTIVSKDGFVFSCHRFVLSSCSSFLSKILSESVMAEPVIMLPDVSQNELNSLIQFMYTGEASVTLESLERFFEIGNFLQISQLNNFLVLTNAGSENEESNTQFKLEQDLPTTESDGDLDETATENYPSSFGTTTEETPDSWNNEAPDKYDEVEEIAKELCRKIAAQRPRTRRNRLRGHRRRLDESQINNYSDKSSAMVLDLGSEHSQRYQCKKCGNRYSHKRTVLHHIHWICEQPATFVCPICPYSGKRRFQLKSHIQRTHMQTRKERNQNKSLLIPFQRQM